MLTLVIFRSRGQLYIFFLISLVNLHPYKNKNLIQDISHYEAEGLQQDGHNTKRLATFTDRTGKIEATTMRCSYTFMEISGRPTMHSNEQDTMPALQALVCTAATSAQSAQLEQQDAGSRHNTT